MSLDFNVTWSATLLGEGRFDDFVMSGINYSTTKLEFSEDINSLYCYGELNFSGNTEWLEKKYLTVGQKIQFNIVRDSSDRTQDINIILSIMSLINLPGTKSYRLGEGLSISLVSPWYFTQLPKSKAYRGSASAIASEVIKEILPTNTGLIADTKDNSVTVRYRTFETAGKFLENKIVKYSLGTKGSPSFLFGTLKNTINFLDIDSILSNELFYGIDISSPKLDQYNDLRKDPKTSGNFLYINSPILAINKKKTLWAKSNSGLAYIYRHDSSFKSSTSTPVFPKITASVNKPFTYVTSNKKPALTNIYLDDTLRPYSDIYAETLHNHTKDMMDNHEYSYSSVLNMYANVGSPVHNYFLNADNGDSLFSQVYLITGISHVFVGNRGISFVTTKMPSYSYHTEAGIKDLFHREP